MTRLRPLLLGATMTMALAIPVSASRGVSASSASRPPFCLASALFSKVGQGGAATGTSYFKLLFIYNKSSGSCTLSGTPTTELGIMTGSRGLVVFKTVGPAAAKLKIAGRGKAVTVKPGVLASVTIGIETADNYTPSMCKKANVTVARMVFQNGATFYFGLPRVLVCTKLASTTTSGVISGLRYP